MNIRDQNRAMIAVIDRLVARTTCHTVGPSIFLLAGCIFSLNIVEGFKPPPIPFQDHVPSSAGALG